ncbi:MAG TPA: hypothetical protein VGK46_05580, partial [Saprospiraceae bacterium]
EYSDAFATNSVHYVDETRTWILVQAAFGTEGRQIFRVELRNNDFELITSSSLDTFGSLLPCHIDTYQGKTYILGSILGPPRDELLYLEYSHADPFYLPDIVIKQSEPKPTGFLSSMKVDERTGEMLIFYYDGMARLDTNLHQVIKLGYPDIQTSDLGTARSTPTRYYSHGTANHIGGSGPRLNVLHMYDTAFTILQADTFGILIPDNFPFYMKSLDLRNEEMLIGGHLDGPFSHFQIYKSIKKFYLAKYNTDMTQQWYKEYGDDRAYWMAGVHLLENGSSLAYGFVTDSMDNYRYAYILHVDENGGIISSQVDPEHQGSSIQLVNPGNERLCILNPGNLTVQIFIYTLDGIEVFNETFNSSVKNFEVDEFPEGIYPYMIQFNEKVIKTGMWVKGK